jgi:hypothetical protein
MNYRITPKTLVGSFVAVAVLLLLVSYLLTQSLNPLAVYASNSILAKIIVSLLLAWLALTLLSLLSVIGMRKAVAIGGGQPADDVRCPGCTLPLFQYAGSHGQPIQCIKCGIWWHRGPACYNKGMPHAIKLIPTYPCFDCRSKGADDRDLFDEKDFPSFT